MAINVSHKVNSLPTTKQSNAIYYVVNGSNCDLYATNNAGTEYPIFTNQRVNDLITSALSGQSAIEIVNDISARDALTLSANAIVLVLDATADSTVDTGAATYAYRHSDTSFNKISEHESQDVQINWDDINGGPTSTPAQIDTAVNNSHTHTNITSLNKISENASNELVFNGTAVNAWGTLDW